MADNTTMSAEWQEMLERDAGLGVPEISDRDRACAILPNLDYEAQLLAISGLLQRNEEADKRVEAQMKELDEYARKSTGWRNERALEEFGEYFYVSIYQGAAHSMAALGMLAPLYESMFFQAFQGIRRQFFGADAIPPCHARSAMASPDVFWDCHLLFNARTKENEKKLVSGIEQLAEAVGLTPHLPADLHGMLEALFGYRNKMFHCGFEWPENECGKFAKRIEQEKRHGWFSRAEHGDEPWIFYMTDDFISHCLDMVHKLLESFGAYCKGRDMIHTIPIG